MYILRIQLSSVLSLLFYSDLHYTHWYPLYPYQMCKYSLLCSASPHTHISKYASIGPCPAPSISDLQVDNRETPAVLDLLVRQLYYWA